eukprot:UN19761
MDELFEDMKGSDMNIAVCVCGPIGLMESVRNACKRHSTDGYRFDFHSELFEF